MNEKYYHASQERTTHNNIQPLMDAYAPFERENLNKILIYQLLKVIN
jgi:hypothetical protein